MFIKEEQDRKLSKINEYRRKLGKMMEDKNMHSDEELVELSQKLDKLIVEYYRCENYTEENSL